jgi:hypothetical protein
MKGRGYQINFAIREDTKTKNGRKGKLPLCEEAFYMRYTS